MSEVKIYLTTEERMQKYGGEPIIVDDPDDVEFLKNWAPTAKNFEELGNRFDDISISDFAYEEYDFIKFLDWTITWEDHYGGEGQGSEYWVVFKITGPDTEKYIYLPGYYESYEGAEFFTNEMYEVVKSQKTVDYWKQV